MLFSTLRPEVSLVLCMCDQNVQKMKRILSFELDSGNTTWLLDRESVELLMGSGRLDLVFDCVN